MKLSKYFTLAEATRSAKAKAAGIDNTPPPEIIENLRYFLSNFMDKVRDHFGKPIIANSIYRSPSVNILVGGSKTSFHTQGLAADFTVDGYTPKKAIGEIIRAGIDFDQLIDEFGEWVHLGVRRDKPNRKQVLVYRRNAYGVSRTAVNIEEAKRW